MQRRNFIRIAAVTFGLVTITAGASAQQAPATVPPLIFKETWKTNFEGEPTDVPSRDVFRRVDQRAVTNPQLELKIYGEQAQKVQVSIHEGRPDLWTGMTPAPVAVLLRHKTSLADLTGLARLRAIVRTDALHVLYPAVKLADGTLLAGHRGITTDGNFVSTEVAFTGMRWYRVDQKTATTNTGVPNPDLSKVDEVGFIDLAPGGGHGTAGWVNLSTIELYAKPVPR